jgi:hypothetical protein
MIGKVVFTYKSNVVEAVMNDEGRWHCAAIPCLVRPLNILYCPAWYGGPLELAECRRSVQFAAHWLHGEAVAPQRPVLARPKAGCENGRAARLELAGAKSL